MATFEEMKTEIRRIWYWLEISDQALIPLQVPATGETRWIIFYGTYGGPASKNDGDPIDCLDLMCKFHDATFNSGNPSDMALGESCAYLKSIGMIKSASANYYATNINTRLFGSACWIWRWVSVWGSVLLGIVATLGALGLLLASVDH
jgi:hypothetical protein